MKPVFTDCSICFESLTPKCCASCELRKLPCGHVYHRHCIHQWENVQRTCPTCRQNSVPNTDLESIWRSIDRLNLVDTPSGQVDRIERVLHSGVNNPSLERIERVLHSNVNTLSRTVTSSDFPRSVGLLRRMLPTEQRRMIPTFFC